MNRKIAIGLASAGLVATVALAGCAQPSQNDQTGEPSGSTIVTAPAGVQSPAGAPATPPAAAPPAGNSGASGVM
jgi:hypothetical protein